MFFVTRDGFTLLAMGFTGAKAMQFKVAYIEAFNAMERTIKESAAGGIHRRSEEAVNKNVKTGKLRPILA